MNAAFVQASKFGTDQFYFSHNSKSLDSSLDILANDVQGMGRYSYTLCLQNGTECGLYPQSVKVTYCSPTSVAWCTWRHCYCRYAAVTQLPICSSTATLWALMLTVTNNPIFEGSTFVVFVIIYMAGFTPPGVLYSIGGCVVFSHE